MRTKKYTILYLLTFIAMVGCSFVSSCKRDRDENPPLVITVEAKNIGSTIALSGGTIVWEDESAITGRGTCWGTMVNPTIEGHKTDDGEGTGSFESVLTGLLPNTSYYTRTYVIKNGRVIYGNLVSFKTQDVVTDIDGNIYNRITIGKQVWMAENLRTTRFLNGDAIGTTIPATKEVMYESDPIYQWAYDGNEKNSVQYGRLYTWYAVMDPRGICPEGWHVPSDAEWTEMEKYLIANKYNYDGTIADNKIAKSMTSSSEWRYSEEVGTLGYPDNTASSNNSGFAALPAGYRNSEGAFVNIGSTGCWWSSTEYKTYDAYYRYLYSTRNDLIRSSYYEFCAVSVRCIKN